MPIRPSALFHATLGASVVGAAILFAGQPGDKAAPNQPPAPAGNADQQKMMQDWMKRMAPGKAHEGLKKTAGVYDCTTRMWMDPKGPAQESKGTATFKMILNDRFLQQDFDGKFMGMPFSGHGMMGFDNNRKQYTMCWADTMTTAFTFASGGISPDGKTISMFGTMDEPSMGEIGKNVKYVVRHDGDDHMFLEAWEVNYGDPFKVFEVEYTRKK